MVTATLVVVTVLVTGVCALPVGIPYPRHDHDTSYARDDPYAHYRYEETTTPKPVHIPVTPPPDLNFSTSTPRPGSALHAVKFMQQFGYVPKGDNDTDFLFTSQSLEEAIKRMQRFGNIPQTGLIDNATLVLMETPRCGLPDMDPQDFLDKPHIRRKRYIVGSGGWNKRRLTYYVANWSPQLRSKEVVQRELRRAFDAWSTYSHLQFNESSHQDADIIIFFANYAHGDGYAFDGPSGILAHAYYPYEFGSYGGDVHFDESETWTTKPKDQYSGLDFFTVAVHEIGHSLGLAHSPVSGSIMFPYYKGYTANFALDYDDVMAMWELYIKRKLKGDDEYFKSTTSTTTTTPENDDRQSDAAGDDHDNENGDGDGVHKKDDGGNDDEDFYEEDRKRREEVEKTRAEERRRQREEEEERRRWEEDIRRKEEETRRREEEERRRWEEEEDNNWGRREEASTKPPPTLPNICYGNYDAVAMLRRELFIFKDEYLWRYSERGRIRPGYPSLIRTLFPALPAFLKKVDAVYERDTDSSIVFFIGKYYYVHDGNRLVEDSPRPLTDLGLPEIQTSIDAAFYWPRAKKTYFFSKNWYFRYNDTARQMDSGYPKDISKWNGLPGDLDDAFTWTDGQSYFLRGYQFWKFDNVKIKPAAGYPKEAPQYWAQCPSNHKK
ncbi:matrix metalloproteinase-17-like [Homarus americanus]|uniref:Matrix metalloproteinase-17-like n=1 Tax=Homarus americanus TaxID=6706 RepID=A0A8J5JJA4_HOMAM|nr:matrix metalloproteinase-17-like [Homarus americanus]KAG7157008.1 Matrix metalloproteinase-17-like [Homarus americanus]